MFLKQDWGLSKRNFQALYRLLNRIYERKFNIVTDHKSLQWLFSMKDPSSKLTYRFKWEEYDYKICYEQGSSNKNIDFLIRINVNVNAATEVNEDSEGDENSKANKNLKALLDYKDNFNPSVYSDFIIVCVVQQQQSYQFGLKWFCGTWYWFNSLPAAAW